jgi:hypothetical protein|tara:strand:- start:1943 stop:2503 length:561 start_codon:yes stop_codon:yes gene_type:complete
MVIKMSKTSYYMDDEKWDATRSKVDAWIEQNGDNPIVPVITGILAQAQENADSRKRLWGAITAMFSTVDNSPIKKGKPRESLPDAVEVRISGIVANVTANKAQEYMNNPYCVLESRSRVTATSEVFFGTAEEYGEYHGSRVERMLIDAYRAHVKNDENARVLWDGESMNGDMPDLQVIAPNTEEEE